MVNSESIKPSKDAYWKMRSIDSLFTSSLALIRDKAGKRCRPDDLSSIDMQTLHRIAKTLFRFVCLDVQDLFDIGRLRRMAHHDLELCARCVRHIVRFENGKASGFADLTIHQPP